MYCDITVIVAGAVDETAIYTDETILESDLKVLENESYGDGYRMEIYRLDHDHEQGIDCECVQYLTDHHPYRVFNPEGST